MRLVRGDADQHRKKAVIALAVDRCAGRTINDRTPRHASALAIGSVAARG
jgi:hypothetical protein